MRKSLEESNVFNNTDFNKAHERIKEILRTEKASKSNPNIDVKIEILNLTRNIFSNKFNIYPDTIIYEVAEFDKDSLMELCFKGDGKFRININMKFMKNSSISSFLTNVCYEYGHIKQVIDELHGKKVPYSMEIDWERLALVKPWERIGTKILYMNSKSEQDASEFSFSQIGKWLKEARKSGKQTKVLFSNRRCYIKEKRAEKLSNFAGYRLRSWWEINNYIVRLGKDLRPVKYVKISEGFVEKDSEEKE